MSLFPHGSFLQGVYEHENEIRGTKEELEYYSYNSNEQHDETGMRHDGVFTVEGVDNGNFKYTPNGKGYCRIIIHSDRFKSPELSRRLPITLNQFNIIAKKYKISKYILYNEKGLIISALFGVDTDIIHLFEFDVALRRFEKYKKVLLPNEIVGDKQIRQSHVFTTKNNAVFTTDDKFTILNKNRVCNTVKTKIEKGVGKFIQYWFTWNGSAKYHFHDVKCCMDCKHRGIKRNHKEEECDCCLIHNVQIKLNLICDSYMEE
jgi:hypothetical protein